MKSRHLARIIGILWMCAAVAVTPWCFANQAFGQDSELRILDTGLKELARKVAPAVVQIRATVYTSGQDDDEEDGDANEDNSGLDEITGSGVIMDTTGYILTNAHVVEDAATIAVTVAHGNSPEAHSVTLPARVVGLFKEADLAVLKIKAEGLTAISIPKHPDVRQGQLVAAFGSPAGLHDSISLGIISSAARQLERDNHVSYVQTDAAINRGNSGGPLVDIDGNLVGVTTMYISHGGGSEGLGFAIPAKLALYVYEELLRCGQVRWADGGIRVQPVTAGLAHALQLRQAMGLVVSDVSPGSSAEAGGILPRDVIVALDGTHVATVPQYFEFMYHKRPGDKLSISVNRDGRVVSTELVLKTQVSERRSRHLSQSEAGMITRLGVMCSQITSSSQNDHAGLRSHAGVLVESRSTGGDLRADLARGDVIRAVNRTAVATVSEVQDILGRLKSGTPVALQVERNGQFIYVLVSDPEHRAFLELDP
jgi:serine protease Do